MKWRFVMETGLSRLLEGLQISLGSRKTGQMKFRRRLACEPSLPAGTVDILLYRWWWDSKLSSLGVHESFVCFSYKKNKQTNNHRKSVEFFVIVKNLSSVILNFYFLQKILGASTHFLCFNEKIIELFL